MPLPAPAPGRNDSARSPSAPAPRLRGAVLDAATGQPVAGAKIVFTRESAVSALSDAAGHFEFQLPGRPAFGWLQAGAAGYATRKLPVQVPFDGLARRLELRLQRAAQVAGQITEPAGRPIAGAEVRVSPLADFHASEQMLSGADGKFSFDDLEGGQAYEIFVVHERFVPMRTEPFWLSPGRSRSADMVLEPASGIEGTVLTSAGEPLAGFLVAAWPEAPAPSPPPTPPPGDLLPGVPGSSLLDSILGQTRQDSVFLVTGADRLQYTMRKLGVTTDEDGSFFLRSLRSGTYVVKAWTADDRTSGSRKGVGVMDGRLTRGIEIVVAEDLHIRGRVLDERGAPVADARVSIRRDVRRSFNSATALGGEPPGQELKGFPTGADGGFDIGLLGPGGTWVRAFGGARQSEELLVEAPAEGVELVLLPGRPIEGVVLDAQDGAAVEEFSVAAVPARMWSPRQFFGFVSPDGSFRIETPLEGRVKLEFQAPGYRRAQLQDLELGQGLQDLRVEMRKSAIVAGAVRDEAGKPAPGASVRVLRGLAPDCFEAEARPVVLTDRQGRFSIGCVETGTLELEVRSPGFRSAQAEVEVPEAEQPEPLELRLERGHCIRGAVLDRRSRAPVQGMVVAAGWQASAPTGDDGRFELCGLPTGKTELTVQPASALTQVTARRTLDVQADIEGLRIEQ